MSKRKVTKVNPTYPILIKEYDFSNHLNRMFFGIISDKGTGVTKDYDLGNNKIKTVYEHKTYRYVFGIFRYLKSYSFHEYIEDKKAEVKNV